MKRLLIKRTSFYTLSSVCRESDQWVNSVADCVSTRSLRVPKYVWSGYVETAWMRIGWDRVPEVVSKVQITFLTDVKTERDLHSNQDGLLHSPRASKQKYVSSMEKKKQNKTKNIITLLHLGDARVPTSQTKGETRPEFSLFFWWFFVVFWCRRSGFPRKRRNLQSSILKCAKCKIDTWPLFEFIQVFWVQRWSQQREMVFYGASSTTSDNPEEKQTCVCHTCCAILVCSLFCF